MHITRYTDYSLRVLIFTALRYGELNTIKDVADHYGISRNHLMKVVHRLGAAGYVETVRGKKGGFRLAKHPDQIHIGEVVRRMEEDFDIVECFKAGSGRCRIESACSLRGVLHEALAAFLDVLDRYSLADLVKNPQQLSRLLNGDSAPAEQGARKLGL